MLMRGVLTLNPPLALQAKTKSWLAFDIITMAVHARKIRLQKSTNDNHEVNLFHIQISTVRSTRVLLAQR